MWNPYIDNTGRQIWQTIGDIFAFSDSKLHIENWIFAGTKN